MLFRRRNRKRSTVFRAGRLTVASGVQALLTVDANAGASVVATRAFVGEPLLNRFNGEGESTALLKSVDSAASLGAFLVGSAAAGTRVSGLTRAGDLAALTGHLADASARGIPFVLHHSCTAGSASPTAHDGIRSALDAGAVVFVASSMQHALDLAVVGRRVAEETLLPVVIAQDACDPDSTVESLQIPDRQLVERFLGGPDDEVPAPTPAQEILFGSVRRRLPRLIDVGRPVGIGARSDHASMRKSISGRRLFVYDHVAAISDRVMAEFARESGRPCSAIEGYRAEDADYLVVARGQAARRLQTVVDHHRKHRKARVGVVEIVQARPFPGRALSHFLKGKKSVAVLDESQQASGAGQLAAAVSDTIDRAVDLVDTKDAGGWAAFGRGDAPQIQRLTSDTTPNDVELTALVDNLVAGGRKALRIGARFAPPALRLPPLERLAQRIQKNYPEAGENTLPVGESLPDIGHLNPTIVISGSAGEAREASHVLAEGIFSSFAWPVRSAPVVDGGFAATVFGTTFRPDGQAIIGRDQPAEILAVIEDDLLRNPVLLQHLRSGGAVIMATNRGGSGSWRRLGHRVRELIRASDLRLFIVGPDAADDSEGEHPYRLLSTMRLAGAAIAVRFDEKDRQLLLDGCAAAFARRGLSQARQEAFIEAMRTGAANVTSVEWKRLAAEPDGPEAERPAPWTAREEATLDETVFDAGRFWHSVGYLYETGRPDEALVDPFVASGIVPARTSAFRSWSDATSTVASFVPENCTGCGACWSICPDAALPATIQDVGTLVEQCFRDCNSRNVQLTQLERIKQHVIKQAHQLVAADELHAFRSLDTLLQEAFERILGKLGADESQEQQLRSEFEAVLEATRALPLARTEVFFTAPEKATKGSGLLLTVAVNADACKACGLCTDVCKDEAIELIPRSRDRVEADRARWSFARSLPVVSAERIASFVTDEDPESLSYRLLNWRSYHATVGGDAGQPGDGARATVHLVTSFIDATVRDRMDAFVRLLDEMISRFEERIEESVRRSMAISDFEQFRKRLDEIGDEPLDSARLAEVVAGKEADVDARLLRRLTDSLLDLRGVREHFGSNGGRATMAATLASGVGAGWEAYPYNPFSFPWIRAAGGDVTATAEGMFAGVMDQVVADFRSVRKARLILDNVYDPKDHDPLLEKLRWTDLSPDEWAMCPPILVLAESIDQVLPQFISTEVPLKVLVLDRSVDAIHGATPGLWPLARPDFFVLHGTAGYPGHLLRGVADGMAWRGPALFRLFVSDPDHDGVPPNRVAERMRLAVDSRAVPLLQYNPGADGEWVDRWSLNGNPDPQGTWVTRSREDDTPAEAEAPFTLADWAAGEGRFADFFEPVPHNLWTPDMISLVDYLELSESDRIGRQPFVSVSTAGGREARLRVHPLMVNASASALRRWGMIQELSGVRSTTADSIRHAARVEADEAVERIRGEMAAALAAEKDRKLAVTSADYHALLTERLLTLSGYGPGAQRSGERLRDVVEAASAPKRESDDGSTSPGSNGSTSRPPK